MFENSSKFKTKGLLLSGILVITNEVLPQNQNFVAKCKSIAMAISLKVLVDGPLKIVFIAVAVKFEHLVQNLYIYIFFFEVILSYTHLSTITC